MPVADGEGLRLSCGSRRALDPATERAITGERDVSSPARVVFAPAHDAVFWAGEDEEGLLVAGMHGLARLRPGEPPKQSASTRFVIHHALSPRGAVWLDRSGERTAV